jgi:hypothetical protein
LDRQAAESRQFVNFHSLVFQVYLRPDDGGKSERANLEIPGLAVSGADE